LGWPIDRIPAYVAGQVLQGARKVCGDAGIALAGGHSIDAPEPIFGLAVTGKTEITRIKKNTTGKPGDLLYLTKPLGIGMVTTAEKKKVAVPEDLEIARKSMLTLNHLGVKLGKLSYVHSMTDVTGFGLAGHLLELCDGAGLSAQITKSALPLFDFVPRYLELNCIPGGTNRNWKTYGHHFQLVDSDDYKILADPQTSGGLLVAIDPEYQSEFSDFLATNDLNLAPIGKLIARSKDPIIKVIR